MRLSNGEVVTVQPGSKPVPFLASEVPSAVLAAVRNRQDLAVGRFHAVYRLDDITWTRGLPAPSGGRSVPRSASALRTPMSATTSSSDHSTDGWYMPDYSQNPAYTGQGYTEFAADMGLPTLYLPAAGGSGSYVYYSPTTQGSDGNPLEVGLATEPDAPYPGVQHIFIYDWSTSGGGPCSESGYPACKGFVQNYAPTVNSSFTSNYVRVLSYGMPEWSIETFEQSGIWYFGIYNHTTAQWEFPYSEQYSEQVHNYTLNSNGPSGGHGYAEYYIPSNTTCASGQSDDPTVANTIESDAQQYSQTMASWTRISNDAYRTQGLDGPGTCFSGANAPYFTVSTFGDGWSDWDAVLNGGVSYPCSTVGGTCNFSVSWQNDGPYCNKIDGPVDGYTGTGQFTVSPSGYGTLTQNDTAGTAQFTRTAAGPVTISAQGQYESFTSLCAAHFTYYTIKSWNI